MAMSSSSSRTVPSCFRSRSAREQIILGSQSAERRSAARNRRSAPSGNGAPRSGHRVAAAHASRGPSPPRCRPTSLEGSRSSRGSPIRSAMTSAGRGPRDPERCRSSRPHGRTPAARPQALNAIPQTATVAAVNDLLTRVRSRVCSGGSRYIIQRLSKSRSSRTSPAILGSERPTGSLAAAAAMRHVDRRNTAATSSYRVRIQPRKRRSR